MLDFENKKISWEDKDIYPHRKHLDLCKGGVCVCVCEQKAQLYRQQEGINGEEGEHEDAFCCGDKKKHFLILSGYLCKRYHYL